MRGKAECQIFRTHFRGRRSIALNAPIFCPVMPSRSDNGIAKPLCAHALYNVFGRFRLHCLSFRSPSFTRAGYTGGILRLFKRFEILQNLPDFSFDGINPAIVHVYRIYVSLVVEKVIFERASRRDKRFPKVVSLFAYFHLSPSFQLGVCYRGGRHRVNKVKGR